MKDMYLTRKIFTDKSTIGKLVFNDLELWTLEDTARKVKIYGETCIPAGIYKIEVRQSLRFGKPMPYLLDVPLYEGVMIHPGNFPIDTFGCILVGLGHTVIDKIDESVKAFEKLFPLIDQACKEEVLRIHISGGYRVDEFQSEKSRTLI